MSDSGANHTKRGLSPTAPQAEDQSNKRQCLSAAATSGGAAAAAIIPPQVGTEAEAASADGAEGKDGGSSREDAFKRARGRIQTWLNDGHAESASFIADSDKVQVTITATLKNTSTKDTWTLNDYIEIEQDEDEGQPKHRKWSIEPGQTRSISLMVARDRIIVDEGQSSEIDIEQDEIGVGSYRNAPVVGWLVDGEVDVTNLAIRFGSEDRDFSKGGDRIEAVVRGMSIPSYTIQQIQDVMLNWACDDEENEKIDAHMGDKRGDKTYVPLMQSFREHFFGGNRCCATLTAKITNGAETPWNLIQSTLGGMAKELMGDQIIKSVCKVEAVHRAFELGAGESATLEIHIDENGVRVMRDKGKDSVVFEAELESCMPNNNNTPGLLLVEEWLRPLQVQSASVTFGSSGYPTVDHAITDADVNVDEFLEFIRGIKSD